MKGKSMFKFLKKYIKEIVSGLFIGLILILIVQRFFIIATIPSESMQTTLMVGDKVYIKTNIDEVERGRIYTFKKDGEYMIKRAVGIEGDHIQVKGNDVYLNGDKLEEDYVSSSISEDTIIDMDFIVPEDKVFFLGDNREVSADGRYWKDKFVDKKDIIGLATKILFPFDRIEKLY